MFMEKIQIRYDIVKFIFAVCGSILFVLSGIYIISMAEKIFDYIVGFSGIIFFGWCGIVVQEPTQTVHCAVRGDRRLQSIEGVL
jgi:hypothetical protein